ncbi:DUF6221 family protein [Catenuloplanes atrovinosus]|uniref:DUF6221 family protein n=1 Tax=Catenuloplanes atrovinosus TaxID=137266 RepID=UPI0035B55C92
MARSVGAAAVIAAVSATVVAIAPRWWATTRRPATPAEAHTARWTPDHTLQLNAALRRILQRSEFTDEVKDFEAGYDQALADVIRDLASAWSHRPGYRPEWAPQR